MERMDYSISRHPEFRYKTEFQSHEPEVILRHQLILLKCPRTRIVNIYDM